MRRVEESFPEVDGYKTRAGAYNRLASIERLLINNNVLTLIVHRPADNRFLPVALLNDKNEHIMMQIIDANVCVIRP
jgi:hypothetical protein